MRQYSKKILISDLKSFFEVIHKAKLKKGQHRVYLRGYYYSKWMFNFYDINTCVLHLYCSICKKEIAMPIDLVFDLNECPICSSKQHLSNKKYIIYGIYSDTKELYYIGYTTRALEARRKEHMRAANNPLIKNSQQYYLYKKLREDLHADRKITFLEISSGIGEYEGHKKEEQLIRELNPTFNYIGIKVPYKC